MRAPLWLYVALLCASVAIKACQLTDTPAGFFADEALVGYEAANIAATGRDHYGTRLPLFFRGFAYDGLSPYHVYGTVPFIWAFGLDETTTRLAPVVWSSVEIVVFAVLLQELVSPAVAVLGAVLLLLTPWHFYLGRVNLGDFWAWTLFTELSLLFLLRARRSGRWLDAGLAGAAFALTGYAYTPARLLTPLVLGAAVMLSWRIGKKLALLLVVYACLSVPSAYYHLTDVHSADRLQRLSGVTPVALLSQAAQPEFRRAVMSKYLRHFDDDWLFKKGDASLQEVRRHSIPDYGLLFKWEKPFILLGVIAAILAFGHGGDLILVVGLLAALPDSLVVRDEAAFATRAYLLVMPLTVLVALAADLLLRYLPLWWRRAAVVALCVGLTASGVDLERHFVASRMLTAGFWGWQSGPREAINHFLAHCAQYDDLVLSAQFNAPEIFPRFYDPEGTCPKMSIGDLSLRRPGRRQLFALRPYEITTPDSLLYRGEILNPDGAVELLLVEGD